MKKFYEMGEKTGLQANELHKAAKFGFFGLIALALATLSGCFKSEKTAAQPPAPAPQTSAQPAPRTSEQQQTLQDLVDSMDKSTGTVTKPSGNCGPYPGYPCGTKYYTVSAGDFKRA